MIPLSHYNWSGVPPWKERLKQWLFIAWIVFICPMVMFGAVGVVYWYDYNFSKVNNTLEMSGNEPFKMIIFKEDPSS